jgi:hypothetical protein
MKLENFRIEMDHIYYLFLALSFRVEEISPREAVIFTQMAEQIMNEQRPNSGSPYPEGPPVLCHAKAKLLRNAHEER